MLNVFKIKKFAGLLTVGMLPTIAYAVGIIFYNFWIAIACFLSFLLVSVPLGALMIRNPFSRMLEGDGLLVETVDSTGIRTYFMMQFEKPYVKGKLGKNWIKGFWDREITHNLTQPVIAETKVVKLEDGSLQISLTKKDFNNARQGLFHWPLLTFNPMLGTFITKEMFSNLEKDSFIENLLIFLNRKTEDLTTSVRDFGRYYVELQKPKGEGGLGIKGWGIIIIGILLVVLGIIFAPKIMAALQGSGATSAASGALEQAKVSVG